MTFVFLSFSIADTIFERQANVSAEWKLMGNEIVMIDVEFVSLQLDIGVKK